jgi:RND superfamily putative drug exporter
VGVTAGPASPNRLVQTALAAMPNNVVNGSSTAAGDAIKVLRADIKPLMAGTSLSEGVTGSAAQQLDSQQSSKRAEQIVLLATLVLILILLLVIFRSPIIAILPLIVITLVSQVATGLISDVNKALNLNTDSSISTILIVVLFGIGTDYILFLMFRYRERLRSGEDSKQAMASAVARVGEVISSAAGVVIVAFLALLLSTLSVLRSLGPTLAIAVAVTLIAGLTLVPAVVSLLGPRVFWPSKAWRREPKAARFAAIGRALAGSIRRLLRALPGHPRHRGLQLQAHVRPVLGGYPEQRRVSDGTEDPGKRAAARRDRPDGRAPAQCDGPATGRVGHHCVRGEAEDSARRRFGRAADREFR